MMIRNAMTMTEFMEAFLSKTSEDRAKSWREIAGPPVKEAADWLKSMKKKYGSTSS